MENQCPERDGRNQRCVKPIRHAEPHSASRLMQSWVPVGTTSPPGREAGGNSALGISVIVVIAVVVFFVAMFLAAKDAYWAPVPTHCTFPNC